MGVERYTTIRCDTCDEEDGPHPEGALILRRMLRNTGWRRSKHDGRVIDTCPDCSRWRDDVKRGVA